MVSVSCNCQLQGKERGANTFVPHCTAKHLQPGTSGHVLLPFLKPQGCILTLPVCCSGCSMQALAMLVGGLLLATWSTHRILEAVKEEAEVVQLAQQLHAKETLLLQAAEVEQKARGVALAVGSVEQVAESLGSIGRGQSEQA